MNRAAIAVGSNIDPEHHIAEAERIIAQEQTLIGKSGFVLTRPLGIARQPDFLNGAFLVDTELGLAAFEVYLKDVQVRLGRARSADKFGPRTIDLDLIVWNRRIVDSEFYTREFVRNAVLELIPDLLSGYTGKTGPRRRRPVPAR